MRYYTNSFYLKIDDFWVSHVLYPPHTYVGRRNRFPRPMLTRIIIVHTNLLPDYSGKTSTRNKLRVCRNSSNCFAIKWRSRTLLSDETQIVRVRSAHTARRKRFRVWTAVLYQTAFVGISCRTYKLDWLSLVHRTCRNTQHKSKAQKRKTRWN